MESAGWWAMLWMSEAKTGEVAFEPVDLGGSGVEVEEELTEELTEDVAETV